MGALAYGCGSIVIDGGWLRVLGSGRERMKRGIYGFSLGKSFSKAEQMPSYLLVADDVLGGFFAINGGAFDGKAGNVFYFALDSGEWEDTQLSYSRFFTGRFAAIYLNFTSFTAGTVGGEDVRKISLDKSNFVRYSGMPV